MSNLARQYQQNFPSPSSRPEKRKVIVRKVKSTITKGEKGLYALLILGIAVVSLIILTNYASIYTVNRDIHNLERSVQHQVQVNEGLQLQAIELSAPDRILYIATEKLGMALDDNKVKVIQN